MAWEPGLPADRDAETARILAGYPPALFGPGAGRRDFEVLWGDEADAKRQRVVGLELLARARIEDVPAHFDGRGLADTIDGLKSDYWDLAAGPKPLAIERAALENAAAGAARFLIVLDRLIKHTGKPGSRIKSSNFRLDWTPDRLDALRRELATLRADAVSADTIESMRRPHLVAGKPEGGWSVLEELYGCILPELYEKQH